MTYPAVTFCRKTPFKDNVLKRFNLSYHPSMTSSWKHFNFKEYTLADVYDQATYSYDEFFRSASLGKKDTNVKIVMSLQFSYGKCYTLIPLVTTQLPWKESGYSIMLHEGRPSRMVNNEASKSETGWNMFLHMPIEGFTEYGISSSGRIENIFVDFDEQIEIKISVQKYKFFMGRGSSCSCDHRKGSSICYENCLWEHIENKVNCSGPWMKKPTKPACNSYKDMNQLIIAYNSFLEGQNKASCDCKTSCETFMYSSFIMDRKPSTKGSQVYIYFTSKMLTTLEEKSNYDSTQFLADMGGMLGFLLGLSVIGIIIIIEKILGFLFLDKLIDDNLRKKKEEEQNSKKEAEGAKEGKFLDME